MDYPIADPSDGFYPDVDPAIEEQQITRLAGLMLTTKDADTNSTLDDFYQKVKDITWSIQLREALVGWQLFGNKTDYIIAIEDFIGCKITKLRSDGFIPLHPETSMKFKGEAFRYIKELILERKKYLLSISKFCEVYSVEFQVTNLSIVGAAEVLLAFWKSAPEIVENTSETLDRIIFESGSCRAHRLDQVRKLLLDLIRFLILHSGMKLMALRKIIVKEFVPYFGKTISGRLCVPENPCTWTAKHREMFSEEMERQMCIAGIATEKLQYVIHIFGDLLLLLRHRVMTIDEPAFRYAMKLLDFKTSKYKYLPVLPEEYLSTKRGICERWTKLIQERNSVFDYLGARTYECSYLSALREYLLYFTHVEMWGIYRVMRIFWKDEQPRLTATISEIQLWDPVKIQECVVTLNSFLEIILPNGCLTFQEEEIGVRKLLTLKIDKLEKALLTHAKVPMLKKDQQDILLRNLGPKALHMEKHLHKYPPGVSDNDILRSVYRLVMEKEDVISLINRITVLSHAYRNLIKLGILTEDDPIIKVVRNSILGVINYMLCRNERFLPLKNDTDRIFLERSYQKSLSKIIRRAVTKSLIPESDSSLNEIYDMFRKMYSLIGELIRYWCTDPAITPRNPCNYGDLDCEELDQVLADLKRLEYCLSVEKYTQTDHLLERFRDYYTALEEVFDKYVQGWSNLESKLICIND